MSTETFDEVFRGEKEMKKKISKTCILAVLMFLFIVGSATNVFATKLNKIVYPKEGHYYIYCGFGTGGDKLYFDKTANWKSIKWGKNGSVWYIRKDKNTGAYRIELAEDSSLFIHTGTNNYSGHQSVTVFQTKTVGDYLWYFHDYGDNNYVLELGENGDKATHANMDRGYPMYVMNRRNKAVANDYLEVGPNVPDGPQFPDGDKVVYGSWKFHLEPTTLFTRKLTKASLPVTAQKNGKVTVAWKIFRDKIKNSAAWKNAKYIEIQYSTDEEFLQNVKTKKIQKGKADKANAKSTLSKLRLNSTYYIRARLIDAKGECSNWSRTVKVKTKK